MAAKQPAVGINHLTVVPTNAPSIDEEREADGDDADDESRDE
ncbi:hypothetical protein [Halobaculum limi]|nr:hypothetical protein [Halobaculum sp. YSMS11]